MSGVLGLLLISCLWQCSKPPQHEPAAAPPAPVSTSPPESAPAPAPAASTTPPPSPQPTHNWDIAQSSLAFATALFQKLAEIEAGNFAFSPASIQIALALACAGARGETAAQMQRAVQLQGDDASMRRAFSEQMARWNADNNGLELSVANRMFLDDRYELLESFMSLAARDYQAGVERVPFGTRPEAARAGVNRWVLKATRSKIRELLPRGSVHDITALVLANAVYLKGKWEHAFRKRSTRPEEFFLASGGSVKVPMMYQKREFSYAALSDQGVRLLELPYRGDNYSMVLVLPEAGKMQSTIEQLSAATLGPWIKTMDVHGKVTVKIPRWKIDPARSTSLKGPLSDMGMPLAFEGGASFTAISGDPTLFISDVAHKAYVDVDEKGTEAAAATAVVMDAVSAGFGGPKPRVFIANRPFLFLIRDRKTDVILFMGRVLDPRQN